VINNYTCSRVMAVYIYYYQYNLNLYDLCMFILYLVSITRVLKDTSFGLDNWSECGNIIISINVGRILIKFWNSCSLYYTY
jgi:hypothetical protein